MTILITRPEPEGQATAERLATLGLQSVVAPVLTISATHQTAPLASYHAALATSANALRLMEPRLRRRLVNTPIYCVGEKTANAACAQGFHDIHTADGDGKSLAHLVLKDFPHTAQFLYLTGTPRKPHLEDELQAAGANLVAVDLYRSEPVSDWPNATKRAVQHVTQILHYSRASADAFLALISNDEFIVKLRDAKHLCLSDDVAISLRNEGLKSILVAAKPNEAALFDLIDRKDL